MSLLSYLQNGYTAHPWVAWLVALYLLTPALAYGILPRVFPGNSHQKRRLQRKHSDDSPLRIHGEDVIVCVLGDLGHSPRMCYHARSLAARGYHVDLLGYVEEQPPLDIIDSEMIDIHEISVVKNTRNLPYLVFGALKVGSQTVGLFRMLLGLGHAQAIVLQNPPSLPLLLVVIVYKYLVRWGDFQIVVDWHNLNYTILNLKYQNVAHPVVRLMKGYERVCARYADVHLTVTRSLKKFLVDEFAVEADKILVVYDRPAEQFTPLEESGSNFQMLTKRFPQEFSGVSFEREPRIIVTSTSFTPDEDLGVLLTALERYNKEMENETMDETKKQSDNGLEWTEKPSDISSGDLTPSGGVSTKNEESPFTSQLPPLLVLVTGKGPLKAQFLAEIARLAFPEQKIQFKCLWLSAHEYPILISHAHVGVSLHTSSSGIDLPMKVLDFFGCGVPVVALDFQAVGELVHEGVNGLVVDDPSGLCKSLKACSGAGSVYAVIKRGAMAESKRRWDENWNKSLGGVFPGI